MKPKPKRGPKKEPAYGVILASIGYKRATKHEVYVVQASNNPVPMYSLAYRNYRGEVFVLGQPIFHRADAEALAELWNLAHNASKPYLEALRRAAQ